MSMKIGYNEPLEDGWKRIMGEELKKAIDIVEAENRKDDLHEAVHEVRKSLKKLRAGLRLVRADLETYSQENAFFRDQGRIISEIRDTSSMLEAVDQLKSQYNDNIYKNTFDTLEKTIRKKRDDQEKKMDLDKKLGQLHSSLSQMKKEMSGRTLEFDEDHTVCAGMSKVYKRGYKAYKEAEKTRSVEDLHEWRKRSKYLRYQMKMMERLWPGVMDTFEEELHELTDLLGSDHDLAVLHESIENGDLQFESNESKELFMALLLRQREHLINYALLKGGRFYFEKPGQFESRIARYIELHRQEITDKELAPEQVLEY